MENCGVCRDTGSHYEHTHVSSGPVGLPSGPSKGLWASGVSSVPSTWVCSSNQRQPLYDKEFQDGKQARWWDIHDHAWLFLHTSKLHSWGSEAVVLPNPSYLSVRKQEKLKLEERSQGQLGLSQVVLPLPSPRSEGVFHLPGGPQVLPRPLARRISWSQEWWGDDTGVSSLETDISTIFPHSYSSISSLSNDVFTCKADLQGMLREEKVHSSWAMWRSWTNYPKPTFTDTENIKWLTAYVKHTDAVHAFYMNHLI